MQLLKNFVSLMIYYCDYLFIYLFIFYFLFFWSHCQILDVKSEIIVLRLFKIQTFY